jgi:hypothetical protein
MRSLRSLCFNYSNAGWNTLDDNLITKLAVCHKALGEVNEYAKCLLVLLVVPQNLSGGQIRHFAVELQRVAPNVNRKLQKVVFATLVLVSFHTHFTSCRFYFVLFILAVEYEANNLFKVASLVLEKNSAVVGDEGQRLELILRSNLPTVCHFDICKRRTFFFFLQWLF